jgi:hypothetical protein
MLIRSFALFVALSAMVVVASAADGQWNPERFANEQTLEFLTNAAEEGDHWSTVWLVVLDGQVYIRLGGRAAGRIEGNTRAPLVDVRIAGETFHNVRVDPAPEMAERVATAMGDKYWSDIFVRYMSHPLTARLIAQDSGRI